MSVEVTKIIQAPVSAGWVRLTDGEPIVCRRCTATLELHQPDAYDPDRWLGTCEGCGAWHVIGILERGCDAVVVVLPTAEMIAAAMQDRDEGSSPKKSRKPT